MEISHHNQKVCKEWWCGGKGFSTFLHTQFFTQATGRPFWWLMLHWKLYCFLSSYLLVMFPDGFLILKKAV